MKSSPANSKGQALLIVLLSMAVVLTVVLSVISFSVTDIAVTNRESDALRAFSAAEAGVEKALVAVTAQSGSFGVDKFSAAVTGIAEGTQTFDYPADIAAGDEATVWFVGHDTNGNLSCSQSGKPCFTGSQMYVCWGTPGTAAGAATTPAVEVTVYYSNPPVAGNYANINIARAVFDPNSSRQGQNAFASPDGVAKCTIGKKDYAFRSTIDFAALGIPGTSYLVQNGLQLAHVRLFYNTDTSQPVGFDVSGGAGNGQLPSQGERVESTGTAGESTRKVEVFRLYSDIATVFETALFSSGGVVK